MAKKRYFYAEKEDATITVTDFNATDSSISVDINHNGTPKIGYVEIVDGKPVFTEGAIPEGEGSTAQELLKKHKFALFMDSSKNQADKWVRIGKATEFTRNMNPVTEEYDYIEDEHPTTEVTDYKPSESMSVKTIKNRPDFEMFYSLYKARAIGTDAHRNILCVFMLDYSEVEESEPENGGGSGEGGNTDPTGGNGGNTDPQPEHFASPSEFLSVATEADTGVTYTDGEGTEHSDGVTYTYNGVTYLYDGTKLYTGEVSGGAWSGLTEVDVTAIEKTA